ncbi:DUF4738 domain-containing protein [Flavivirga sp. 57AJ16]|uniref:DUF4738 domain-containing protein n=1 Tax=Flavivirga sp. 57AJ16 TaxID=3025307 RepID=UPI0023653B36|nr:DUF4738 domain-containing protein [Flavivirga sp. 57AJ16]MDD7885676.1 DUF4738 domain-containing protein [Flavivirga sp. 57AJ16]
MNKLVFILLIFTLTLASCDGRNRKYKTNAEVLKENNLLESFNQEIKFVPETYTEIKTDTILSSGFEVKINYRSLENDFVLETRKSKGDSVTKIHYKNFEAQLLVLKNNTIINRSLINKKCFYKFEGASFWTNAIMQFIWVDHEASNKDILRLNTSFCIPNTNECKDFTLKINKQGVIQIEEINIFSNTI